MNWITGIIIFVVVIILFTASSRSHSTIETFNPYLNYNMIYPSLYSVKMDYAPYNKSFYMFPDGYYKPSASAPNYRYYPGYRDYWYIPKHEYLKSWMNGPDPAIKTNPKCTIPSSTSEYCVNKFIQNTGNLDLAINSCTLPPKISPECVQNTFPISI